MRKLDFKNAQVWGRLYWQVLYYFLFLRQMLLQMFQMLLQLQITRAQEKVPILTVVQEYGKRNLSAVSDKWNIPPCPFSQVPMMMAMRMLSPVEMTKTTNVHLHIYIYPQYHIIIYNSLCGIQCLIKAPQV